MIVLYVGVFKELQLKFNLEPIDVYHCSRKNDVEWKRADESVNISKDCW